MYGIPDIYGFYNIATGEDTDIPARKFMKLLLQTFSKLVAIGLITKEVLESQVCFIDNTCNPKCRTRFYWANQNPTISLPKHNKYIEIFALHGDKEENTEPWSPSYLWITKDNCMISTFPSDKKEALKFEKRVMEICSFRYCCNVAKSKCSKCHTMKYCSSKCQTSDWNEHKKLCQHIVKHDSFKHVSFVNTRMWSLMQSLECDFVTFQKSMNSLMSDHILPSAIPSVTFEIGNKSNKHSIKWSDTQSISWSDIWPDMISISKDSNEMAISSLRMTGKNKYINFGMKSSKYINVNQMQQCFKGMFKSLCKLDFSDTDNCEVRIDYDHGFDGPDKIWVALIPASVNKEKDAQEWIMAYPRKPIFYSIMFPEYDGLFPWHSECQASSKFIEDRMLNFNEAYKSFLQNSCSKLGCMNSTNFICHYCRKTEYCSIQCQADDKNRHEHYCIFQMVLDYGEA
jgi:hypothetical protein